MPFGWDPPKNDRDVRERGLPFAVAMALFDGPTLEVDDTRCDYGERRIIAYGAIVGQALVCVYTGRGSCQRRVHLEVLDGLFGGPLSRSRRAAIDGVNRRRG
jgi:uncharacterized DUF497 family protein